MKKLFLFILTLGLVISLCACGSEKVEEESSSMPDISAVESQDPTPTPPPADVKIIISSNGVNVRAEPNTDCEVYGNVTFEAFYLLEEDDGSGFHKILFEDKEAYIYSEYCELKTMTASEAEALVGEVLESTESQEESGEDEPTVSVNSEDGQRR